MSTTHLSTIFSSNMSKRRELPEWMKNAATRQNLNPRSGENGQENKSLLTLPLLQYEGRTIYSYHESDCAAVCEDILSNITDTLVVGFDMEWPVTFQKGVSDKTATIQMCTSKDTCYIFHVAAMSNIWKLARDFDNFPAQKVIKESVKELSTLANTCLNSSQRWSLDGLVQNLLGHRLNKATNIRQGQWDRYPLPQEMLEYAATDAFASLLVCEELERRKSESHKS